MRFNGAPELINGRLSMVALLVAASNEMSTGQTVMQQFAAAPLWTYLAFAGLVYASLVPMMKGARHEAFGERALPAGWRLAAAEGAGHSIITGPPAQRRHSLPRTLHAPSHALQAGSRRALSTRTAEPPCWAS
jgi:hypothetical protein